MSLSILSQEHHFAVRELALKSTFVACHNPAPLLSHDSACLVACNPLVLDWRSASEGHPRLRVGASICEEVARCMLRKDLSFHFCHPHPCNSFICRSPLFMWSCFCYICVVICIHNVTAS